MTGNTSNEVSSTVLFIDYAEIGNSFNIIISNVVFKTYDKQYGAYEQSVCNLMLQTCLSCVIKNVILMNFEFCGANLIGKSYFSNILMNLHYTATGEFICIMKITYKMFISMKAL